MKDTLIRIDARSWAEADHEAGFPALDRLVPDYDGDSLMNTPRTRALWQTEYRRHRRTLEAPR